MWDEASEVRDLPVGFINKAINDGCCKLLMYNIEFKYYYLI